jgi:hypothetical protein
MCTASGLVLYLWERSLTAFGLMLFLWEQSLPAGLMLFLWEQSLLAIAGCQSASMLDAKPSSRASFAPTGINPSTEMTFQMDHFP